MLCKICENIFNGDPPTAAPGSPNDGLEQTHHPNSESFQVSIAERCQICASFFEYLNDFFLSKHDRWGPDMGLPSTSFSLDSDYQEKVNENAEFSLRLNAYWKKEPFENMLVVRGLHIIPYREPLQYNPGPFSWDNFSARHTMAQDWMSECVENHVECRVPSPVDWHPTRLIDVGSHSTITVPKLILTREHPSFQRPENQHRIEYASTLSYATLSHCWGKTQPVKLLSSNIENFMVDIPQPLPKTFRDAMSVVRSLGIRYLWIDSLCIIQDSQDDWLNESKTMGKVYGNAYVSIAATGAAGSDEGLFLSTQSDQIEFTRIHLNWKGLPKNEYLVTEDLSAWRSRFENNPLIQRGWALQERILAPRILHFTRDQLLWECRKHVVTESFPAGVPQHIQAYHSIRNDMLQCSEETFPHVLADVIRIYTNANLTFPNDKLIAISGLSSEAGNRDCVRGRYFSGMWESHFPFSLVWVRGDMYEGTYPHRRPDKYRAPSWSWASLNCPIDLTWTISHGSRRSDMLVVNDVDCKSSADDFDEQTQRYLLSITGPFGIMTWAEKSSWSIRGKQSKSHCIAKVKSCSMEGLVSSPEIISCSKNTYNDIIFDAEDEDALPDSLWCLPVYTGMGEDLWGDGGPESRVYGLILDLVHQDQFRRVGMFRVGFPDTEALTRLTFHTIVLV